MRLAILSLVLTATLGAAVFGADVMIVVGPSNHKPGSHEVQAGGRLMAHCLENAINLKGIRARVYYEWPDDADVHRRASTVVFIGDQFPAERLSDSDAAMKALAEMVQRGCGIVCVCITPPDLALVT